MVIRFRQYVIAVVLLLAALAVLFIYTARENIREFTEQQKILADNSVQHIEHLISLYLDDLRLSTALFTTRHQQLIAELAANPGNNEAFKAVNEYFQQSFDHTFTFTIADSSGNVLLEGTEDMVGKDCRENIRLFSINNKQSLASTRIHSDNYDYHFDIMHEQHLEDGRLFIFFLTFKADAIAEYLRNLQPAGHEFVLLNQIEPNMIEIASVGAYVKLNRGRQLTSDEISRIVVRQPVNHSMWELVDILDDDLIAAEQYRVYRKYALAYVGFVMGGLLSLVIVWRYLRRKKNGISAQLRDNSGMRLVISNGIDGIANRVIYDAVLQKEVGRATRHLRALSVLLFKIDYFEQYVSAVGKQLSGDSLADVIFKVDSMFQRGGDLFAHHGGDEFAVILPDIKLQDAMQQGERVRQSIESLAREHPASNVSEFITVSIGVASMDAENRMTASELNSAACSALLHAVSHGCNRVSTGET